jgi:hypothetical protein
VLAVSALAERDPQAKRRAGALLVGVLVLWPMLHLAEFQPGKLFEPGNLQVMGGFLAAFLPLATSADFLGLLLKATVETLAMATAGMALAFVIAVPLSVAMTRALSVSRIGPGPGRRLGTARRHAARATRWRGWTWPTACSTAATSCPAGSCSAWGSRACCTSARRCCWPTSRSRRSTRRSPTPPWASSSRKASPAARRWLPRCMPSTWR